MLVGHYVLINSVCFIMFQTSTPSKLEGVSLGMAVVWLVPSIQDPDNFLHVLAQRNECILFRGNVERTFSKGKNTVWLQTYQSLSSNVGSRFAYFAAGHEIGSYLSGLAAHSSKVHAHMTPVFMKTVEIAEPLIRC
jgi:urate oxidase